MDALKSNVYQILDGKKQFVIPVYQRMYSWQHEQCQRLWSDIVAMQEAGRDGHFVGSIVNIGEKVPPTGVQKFMIIDGQQRLTTLTLLLIALRNYVEDNPVTGVNAVEITETLLINRYATGDDRYKMLLTKNDRDILISLTERSPIKADVQSRLLDNYGFFERQIKKQDLAPAEIYESIGKLQIVNITLDRGKDDPQAIFESLNSTGMDLQDSDLIRNYILMGLDSATQTDVYNIIWRPTEVLFDYQHQSKLMDNFFRDYLTMKLGRIPRKPEVYKEFKAYHRACQLTVRELCKDVYNFAKYYTDMYFIRGTDPVLQSLYQDMKTIKMEVAYPFLLKVHDDHGLGVITTPQLREIVGLCVSYVLRRAVCNIPTNSMNKTFATLGNGIRRDDYLNSVKASLVMLDSYRRFPDTAEFLPTFLTRDIYNMNRCRYILGQLENWDNKTVVSVENLTVEHIIPQNPELSPDWKEDLGGDWKAIQKNYLHTIGNLTLTAYNTEMSDSSFTKKRDMDGGFKESALRLNKYVVAQTSWGEAQVIERARELGKVAEKIWPYPALSEHELAPYRDKADPPPQYSLDSYSLNAYNRVLFEKLNTRIVNLGTVVRREFKKLYVAYKVDTNFVDVILLSDRLRLSVNMKCADVVDPKSLCRDVTGIGRWGNGDVEVILESLEHLDDVMAIVAQAFELQIPE